MGELQRELVALALHCWPSLIHLHVELPQCLGDLRVSLWAGGPKEAIKKLAGLTDLQPRLSRVGCGTREGLMAGGSEGVGPGSDRHWRGE